MNIGLIIIILSAIGIVCGILIFIVNRFLPGEPESLKKAEEISRHLPGANCGACGYPGCFAYARALAKDKNTFFTNTCATVLQEPGMLKDLEKILNIEVDPSKMNKKAVVKCCGNSSVIGNYSGIKTCNAAFKLLSGYKECPYGCLGLGDCAAVCPQNAIQIHSARGGNIAVIDPEKCTGCGLCVKACPGNLIKLVPSDTKIVFLCSYDSIKNIPGRKKCSRGCSHCMKCYKTCKYDAIVWNKEKGIPEFDSDKCTLCGACVEICPQDTLAELPKIISECKKEDKKENTSRNKLKNVHAAGLPGKSN